MSSYLIGLIALISGAVISLFCSENHKFKVLSIFSGISTVLCSIPALKVLFSGDVISKSFEINQLFGTVNIVIDPLSAFFIIVISLMSFMGTIYANGYMKHYLNKGMNVSSHAVFLALLIVSMLSVVTIQNALMFLIAWEIMSLSSFFLVIFEDNKKEVLSAGIKYLVYMHISVIFIMLAFILMAVKSASLDFNSFRTVLENNQIFANIAFVLAFIGFGIKAGFVPFHNWLPEAHPAAPSHVSGIMSGVMIKTGIYGILRVLALIAQPSISIGYFVLIVSVLSSMYGVLYAITQHDLKRLLAYHSIENIGIIGIGIGVGMLGLAYHCEAVAILGFAGGILHILNHSIFKELLFLSAGSVYTKTHTRDIESLGGLIKSMPKTAILFLIGSVAISGLPPFNGFVSEFLIYFGLLKGLLINHLSALIVLILAIAGLAIVGTMAILCFTKAFSIIFLGMPRSECAQKVDEDTTISFIFPMSVLAILTLVIGVCPRQVFNIMLSPVSVFTGVVQAPSTVNLMQNISIICLSLIAFIAVLAVLKLIMQNKRARHCTWGCGYDKPNNHIQYTASSYASPFLSMLTPLFKKVFDIKKPKSLFPKDAHFELHIEDVEEAYFLKPFIKSTERFLAKFEKIQNGNIQQYILYGLVFLVLSLIGVVLLG
jgi:formate hydrogenlyase subunit 3/multisubunit Na+/H+ antiporter MnhD subunit